MTVCFAESTGKAARAAYRSNPAAIRQERTLDTADTAIAQLRLVEG